MSGVSLVGYILPVCTFAGTLTVLASPHATPCFSNHASIFCQASFADAS